MLRKSEWAMKSLSHALFSECPPASQNRLVREVRSKISQVRRKYEEMNEL